MASLVMSALTTEPRMSLTSTGSEKGCSASPLVELTGKLGVQLADVVGQQRVGLGSPSPLIQNLNDQFN